MISNQSQLMDSKRQLAAIMFTDIVGYTLMMQEDRQAAISAAKQHEDAVSRSAAQHNGEVINFYGDGSLTLFDTATAAINCAREIQVDLVKKVALRIGIHDGEVVVEDGKAYGDGVNIASRIEGSGHAGVILFSKSIRDKIKNDNSFQFEALGLFRFKNVTNPVELFGLTDKELPVIERSKLRNRVKSRFGIKATATFIGLGLILLLAMVLGNGYLGSRQFDNYTELSIAVMPFENYTLDPELDVVGQMASHWITNGLIDGSRARMVSYDAVHAQGQVLIAGVGSKKSFAQTIGADRTIEGSFAIIGSQHDSLVFTASLNDPGTGERIQGFSEQVCDRKVPLEAIKALLAIIKGFWESQDSKVLSPPKYEAYQAYLTARDLWMEDDQEALHQLNLAIGIDSSFLDPYFLLMDHYYNTKDFAPMQIIVEELQKRESRMNARQRNYLHYAAADVQGNNLAAFDLYQSEYAVNPQDLFLNTTAMVLATDYVNSPKRALEYYDEINHADTDLETCNYCVNRMQMALLAALKLNDLMNARKIVGKLQDHLFKRSVFSYIIRYYARTSDTANINRLLRLAPTKLEGADHYNFLFFTAAREFRIIGNQSLTDYYGTLAIEKFAPGPNRTLARIHYVMNNLETARVMFENLLREEPRHLPNLGRLGVIYARGDLKEEALKVIDRLESMIGPLDYGDVPYFQGSIYAHLGNRQLALEKLRQSVADGKKFWFTSYENDMDLAILKSDPTFQCMIHPLDQE